MRRVWAIGAAVALAVGGAVPAQAMGSSDAYENIQVGVTYTVYEPTYTAGVKAQHIGGNDLCSEGTEENVVAIYGKGSGRQFTISEGNPMCHDIGVGAEVLKRTVQGAEATVVAYCDPEKVTNCTKADVKKYGGNLKVTLPAGPNLRPTEVWIETYGARNISAQQLVRIARGLQPVGG
jgi:hypothetical protein